MKNPFKGNIYHKVTFPQIREMALFHPKTAHGKLNADMIPITPNGFHCSIKK
jgi:hypothetical protein